MDRIQAAVRHYILRYRDRAIQDLQYHRSLDSLDDAISNAALAVNSKGKRYSHQRRLKQTHLLRARYILLGSKEAIAGCKTFRELLALIERDAGSVHGLGELYCYDTALRIGAFLGLMPERVHLHAGTRDGAVALGFDPDRKSIGLRELPEAFWDLEPYEAEDLLCIYKELLKNV